MAHSEFIFEVDDSSFQKTVVERSRDVPIVVDFWAAWCGPCRMLAPILERLVNERKGEVLLAKVNIDDAQNVAGGLGVEAIPHVMAFRDGRPVLDFVGLLPEAQIREFLDRISPSEADRLAQQALPLESSNPAEAEKLFRQALALNRHQETAILGLVRLLIAQDKDAEAKDLLEDLGPGSNQADEVERLTGVLGICALAKTLGDESAIRQRLQAEPDDAQTLFQIGVLLAAQGKHQEALEKLLAAGQRDKQLAEAKVREAMVDIFKIIGIRSPLADDYRQKLSLLLY